MHGDWTIERHGPWAMATRRRLSTRTWQWRMCCVVAMRLCEAHACMHGRAHSFQEDKLMQHATIFVPGKKKPAARGRSMVPAGRNAIEGPAGMPSTRIERRHCDCSGVHGTVPLPLYFASVYQSEIDRARGLHCTRTNC